MAFSHVLSLPKIRTTFPGLVAVGAAMTECMHVCHACATHGVCQVIPEEPLCIGTFFLCTLVQSILFAFVVHSLCLVTYGYYGINFATVLTLCAPCVFV